MTTTTRTQDMSITLKTPRCCPFLVSPPTPQSLAQGSVLLQYILSSAILKFLCILNRRPFSDLCFTNVFPLITNSFPFHYRRHEWWHVLFLPTLRAQCCVASKCLWDSSEVKINSAVCQPVLSDSPQSYISAETQESSADRGTWEQVYLLESELVISSESFRAQPILQDLSPSSKGAFLLETQRHEFSQCGHVKQG